MRSPVPALLLALAAAATPGLATPGPGPVAGSAAAGGAAPAGSEPAPAAAEIQIIDSSRPHQGKLDQLHLVCTEGKNTVDLLPLHWVRFVVEHLGGKVGVGGDSVAFAIASDHRAAIDGGLLLETIENLGPGEEIVIRDGGASIRIWLE